MERNCYTYLIGWKKLNKFYYGVRYSKKCNPNDLWKTYFTSSKFVKQFFEINGQPDVIQIRRCFGHDHKKAKDWENKVLRRLNVISSQLWLNMSVNNSFNGVSLSWNEGLTKETSATLNLVSKKMIEIRKNKKWGGNKGIKKTKEENEINAWSQILKHHPNIKFNTYKEFCEYCILKYTSGLGCYAIASELGVGGGSVETALKFCNIVVDINQSWTKIKRRYPNFQFNSYIDFCNYCKNELIMGNKIYKIAENLGLSDCTIKRAINYAS